jgi:mono/diheme cytochrome c family protein
VRRAFLIALTCAAAALLAGCGSQGVATPTPQTVAGTLPKQTLEQATPAFKLKGDPAAGAAVFSKSGCGSCHTLVEAKSTGTVGPNLDQAQPDVQLIVNRVYNGRGGMPSFKGQLSDKQIADVAAFVYKATHGGG